MPSTVINHYHYYPESEILRVIFVSGLIYEYKSVPKNIYEKMRSSLSKGKL